MDPDDPASLSLAALLDEDDRDEDEALRDDLRAAGLLGSDAGL